MKDNSKGFAPIIILIILVALIGAAYYLGNKNGMKGIVSLGSPVPLASINPVGSTMPSATQTPDPMAGWKEFSSTFGYSLKYPSDWNSQPIPSAALPGQPDLTLYSADAVVDQNLGSLNKGTMIDFSVLQQTSINLPPNMVSDNSFIPSNLSGKAQGYQRSQYNQVGVNIQNGKYVYEVNCFPTSSQAVCRQILSQVLSTFKFTN